MTTLESLVGISKLTGVSFVEVKAEYGQSANTCTFVLDDVTYTAVEDPNDGYRSSLSSLDVGGECSNMFTPCFVSCRYRVKHEEEYNSGDCEILEMKDIFTDEIVLEIGTSRTDDYYPSCVMSFHPEAMAINKYTVKP